MFAKNKKVAIRTEAVKADMGGKVKANEGIDIQKVMQQNKALEQVAAARQHAVDELAGNCRILQQQQKSDQEKIKTLKQMVMERDAKLFAMATDQEKLCDFIGSMEAELHSAHVNLQVRSEQLLIMYNHTETKDEWIACYHKWLRLNEQYYQHQTGYSKYLVNEIYRLRQQLKSSSSGKYDPRLYSSESFGFNKDERHAPPFAVGQHREDAELRARMRKDFVEGSNKFEFNDARGSKNSSVPLTANQKPPQQVANDVHFQKKRRSKKRSPSEVKSKCEENLIKVVAKQKSGKPRSKPYPSRKATRPTYIVSYKGIDIDLLSVTAKNFCDIAFDCGATRSTKNMNDFVDFLIKQRDCINSDPNLPSKHRAFDLKFLEKSYPAVFDMVRRRDSPV